MTANFQTAPKIIAAAGVLILLASLLIADGEAAGALGITMAVLGAATYRTDQGANHGSNHRRRIAGH